MQDKPLQVRSGENPSSLSLYIHSENNSVDTYGIVSRLISANDVSRGRFTHLPGRTKCAEN